MRLIIISNRLPITFSGEDGDKGYKRSIGGLVTGIEAYIRMIDKGQTLFSDYLWVGWPGIVVEEDRQAEFSSFCRERFNYLPVFLTHEIIREFYAGFCNRTIWPLFHFFPDYVLHDTQSWSYYHAANDLFLQAVKDHLEPDDMIWIHDYHLMLLPGLIRQHARCAMISFFLHCPFPAFDIFRQLSHICQVGIINGLLGADLVAFHTKEYAHDFLNCVNRVLKIDCTGVEIPVEDRMARIHVFPMGIDFRGIRSMALSERCADVRKMIGHDLAGRKIVLSIDRLDYTKGILNRLIAFDRLLEDNPEWRGKVVLMLVVAPSRREIPSYLQIKRSIDEWVGKINGTYGTHTWAPVIYQYRQIDGEDLFGLYGVSDIALVTPFKDGMNLIAKEFLAAHTDGKGVLVLSEMAGAFQELSGAIGVNPFRIEELVKAILQGLSMPDEEQAARLEPMLRRLENYDVLRWAEDIMEATLLARKTIPAFAPGELE